MDYLAVLEVVKKLAVEAGALIMTVYEGPIAVTIKSDASPLTLADHLAHDHIKKGLEASFPFVDLLSEEGNLELDRTFNEYCFIVDPLDGTKEFINRNGEFTVNIALAHNGFVILGVIYQPEMKTLYYGMKDFGAYCFREGVEEKIFASTNTSSLKLVSSRTHSDLKEQVFFEKNKERITEVIYMGSSLKGCLVASGVVDCYYRFGPTMEWDTAAMHAICEAAGGIVLQMDGTPLTYNRENHLNEKGFYMLNQLCNDLVNTH